METEKIVKTPELRAHAPKTLMASNAWREIVQSGANYAQIEGFALEYLIDLQRDRAHYAGEGR